MIDHTRAFRRNPTLQNADALNQCERGMYERLKALDEAVVRERLKAYLSTFEIDALLKRRKLILERLDKLIAERGEDKVLYTYTEAAARGAAREPGLGARAARAPVSRRRRQLPLRGAGSLAQELVLGVEAGLDLAGKLAQAEGADGGDAAGLQPRVVALDQRRHELARRSAPPRRCA